MRFRPEHAIHAAAELARATRAGPDGAKPAADLLADWFQEAGLHVERRSRPAAGPPPRGRPVAGWLLAGGLATASAILAARRQIGLSLLTEVLLLVPWIMVDGRAGQGGRRRGAALLLATRSGAVDAPVRVVFRASSGVLRPGGRRGPGRRFLVLLALSLVLDLLLFGASRRVPRALVPLTAAACGGLWIIVLDALRRRFAARRRAPLLPDWSGPAALVELARSWKSPSGEPERLETCFAVVTSGDDDLMGGRALREMIEAGRPARPTLILELVSPGTGPGIALGGTNDGRDLAVQAARDLWVPHRALPRHREGHRFRHGDWPCAILRGEATPTPGARSSPSSREPPIDPQALARTAQLALEIALRWGRRGSNPPHEGDSRARSSQNPG